MSEKDEEDPTSGLQRFKLIDGTKYPACKWKTQKNWMTVPMNGNTAFLTGEVNNIVVIDLDTYKWPTNSEHSFVKKFGNYIDKFDTYTVKTSRGGYHLYFEYTEEISKSTANHETQIDIRSNGGYIVAPRSVVDGGNYDVIRNVSIKPIPDDLLSYLHSDVLEKTDKQVKRKRKKREKRKRLKEESIEPVSDVTSDYVDLVYSRLPENFLKPHQNYLKFTTFCKILDRKDVWEKANVIKCDKCRKDSYYDDINIADMDGIISHMIKVSKLEEYFMCKPLPPDKKTPTETINQAKLGETFFKDHPGNIVIQSDTGTGKTTSTKMELLRTGERFISITPRKSLGEEQYRTFVKAGLGCKYYDYESELLNGDSVVIQLDSIKRIKGFEYHEYISLSISLPLYKRHCISLLRRP